jgi:carboxymethylenebutenolidase
MAVGYWPREDAGVREVMITAPAGPLPAVVAVPDGDDAFPGVVVIHDAGGLSQDTRLQAQWLASAGYLTVAPDLFRGGPLVRCMLSAGRELAAGRGRAFDDLDAARRWLQEQPQCTGRVGVLGFCIGGGFAMVAAFGRGFDSASVNYGTVSRRFLDSVDVTSACPIVASYGRKDWGNRGSADRLRARLDAAGVPNDVKEYPEAGHGFINDHESAGDRIPVLFQLMSWVSRTKYDPDAAADARRRIVAFFDRHLAQS